MHLETATGQCVNDLQIFFKKVNSNRRAIYHTDPWLSQGAWLSASRFMPFC